MVSKITASATVHGQELKDIPVINPDGWWGKTWLIEIGGSYWPLFLVVEAENVQDAIDELADDDQYGHHMSCRKPTWATTRRRAATTAPAGKSSTWIT